ncbi:MAG: ADP-dependent NAD(P)H-hydrate dehydratase, partial [Pseudonocardiaceae bacterium]
DYPGAAVLCAGAAVLATSGMVRFAGSAADAVRARWPEVVATGSVSDAGKVQAWAVGPGLGTGAASRQVLAHVLGVGVPVVADADAITLLARHPELADSRDPGTPLVLTPHDREFERLTGKPLGTERVAAAQDAARRFDAVLLLKGNTTIIAAPDGRVLVNPARSSWPATAGSGDVLTGVLGALLATGLEPATAAATAAHAQELAAAIAAAGGSARIGSRSASAPAPASSIQAALTDAIRTLRST